MMQDGMAFAIKAAQEMSNSISDPEQDYIFYAPIDLDGTNFAYYAYGNWPTAVEPMVSVGVNLGKLFSNPIAFMNIVRISLKAS